MKLSVSSKHCRKRRFLFGSKDVLLLFFCIFCFSHLVFSREVAVEVYGVSIEGDFLVVKVETRGCTQSDDFRFSINDNAVLTVYRTKLDRCRKRPMLAVFRLPFPQSEDLNATFIINNRFRRWRM